MPLFDEQPAVGHSLSQHALDARHAAAQDVEDLLQAVAMPLVKVLDDVGQVVAGAGHALLWAGLGLTARSVGREIRHVPTGDEVAKCGNARMLGKLTERVHGQQIGRAERHVNALVSVVGLFAANRFAFTLPVVQEPEGRPIAPAFPVQPLFNHHRASASFIDGEVIGDERESRLSILNLDRDRTITATRL